MACGKKSDAKISHKKYICVAKQSSNYHSSNKFRIRDGKEKRLGKAASFSFYLMNFIDSQ
jgi:hypothetical protein